MGKGLRRIMVVHDNSDTSLQIEAMLPAKRYAVMQAQTGEQALDLMRKNPGVDLIISATQLADMGGSKLLAEVGKILADPKFIFVTCGGASAEIDTCVSSGHGFLLEPVDHIDLLVAVEDCFKTAPAWDRRHFRCDANLKVTFSSEDLPNGTGYTENIGQGGMFVATGWGMTIGSLIHFCVHFGEDGRRQITASAKVVWVRDRSLTGIEGIGVLFLNLSDSQLAFIRNFVKEKCLDAVYPAG